MRLWFNSKGDDNQFDIKKLVQNIEEERNNWRKLVAYWKGRCEEEEKRKWQLFEQQPNIEFILGDKTNGMVWMEMWNYYKEIKIGCEVELFIGNGKSKKCIVVEFIEIRVFDEKFGLIISFKVEEKKYD